MLFSYLRCREETKVNLNGGIALGKIDKRSDRIADACTIQRDRSGYFGVFDLNGAECILCYGRIVFRDFQEKPPVFVDIEPGKRCRQGLIRIASQRSDGLARRVALRDKTSGRAWIEKDCESSLLALPAGFKGGDLASTK